uniref:Uncharacterized protein n=1 Tax=Variovorax sp. HH01 TaxID=1084736 RepID=I3PCS5_9BURK|nr:hypothetical protein var105 [Variovorax sp. HH01]
MEMEMPFGAPATVSTRPVPVHQVPDAQALNDSDAQVSPAEFLERMNGRAKLDVPHVRGEHKVEMRGTVPAEWSLL